MSNKKPDILSLSMSQDMQEQLKKCAKKKNVSVSKLVRDLIEKYLVIDDEVVPVILRVPANLKGNEEGLNQWLQAKVAAVSKALGVQPSQETSQQNE